MTAANTNSNIHVRPFRLVEYDENWPKLYQHYSFQIGQILGDNLKVIRHFGSTSIPGMLAKPNIDMYAVVKSFNNLREKIQKLEAIGYVSRGDYSGIGEEYFTLDTDEGERIASLHIFEGDTGILDQYQHFHDYLITHEEDKNRYIQLKRKLYTLYKDNYPAYDQGKKVLIAEITAKANAWAQE